MAGVADKMSNECSHMADIANKLEQLMDEQMMITLLWLCRTDLETEKKACILVQRLVA